MKQNIISVAIILGFIALPYMGMAAQRAITVSSLDAAYQKQVSDIDNQIASISLSTSIPKFVNTSLNNFVKASVQESVADNNRVTTIAKLNGDKHILEVAHSLLLESLK